MPRDDQGGGRATSIDGRHFVFDVTVDRLDTRVGGYVVVDDARGEHRLGYVTSIVLETPGRAGPPAADAPRRVACEGRMLEGREEPFGDARIRAATRDEVSQMGLQGS